MLAWPIPNWPTQVDPLGEMVMGLIPNSPKMVVVMTPVCEWLWKEVV